MKGKELIEFIKSNHYEDIEIMIADEWLYYSRIKLEYCKNKYYNRLKFSSVFDRNPDEILIVKSEYDK